MWVCGYLLFLISVVWFLWSMMMLFFTPCTVFPKQSSFVGCFYLLDIVCSLLTLEYLWSTIRLEINQGPLETVKNDVSKPEVSLWYFRTQHWSMSVCCCFPIPAPAVTTALGTSAKGHLKCCWVMVIHGGHGDPWPWMAFGAVFTTFIAPYPSVSLPSCCLNPAWDSTAWFTICSSITD